MADTFSPLLRAILQANQGNINLWGTIFNSGVIDLLEEAFAGQATVSVSFGDVTLAAQNGQTDNSRPMFLNVTGNPAGIQTITVPTLSKLYIVINATSPATSIKFKTALSATITIPPSLSPAIIYVDAVNNLVRHVGRANGITPMSAWVTVNTAIVNRTAGATNVALRYAKQGHLVTLQVPSHTVTTSDGSWGFAAALPAAITPDNGADVHVFPPAFAQGLAATSKAAIFINPAAAGAKWGFTNIGIAAFGAGPFTLTQSQVVVYSVRS